MSSRMRGVARRFYHWLPIPLTLKWQLRARLHPLIHSIQQDASLRGLGRGLHALLVRKVMAPGADPRHERALADVLDVIGRHAVSHGPASHWIALPFLSTGGAEQVALNLCRAVRHMRPQQSLVLIVTDRDLVSDRVPLPEGVLCVVLGAHLPPASDLVARQRLLHDLLRAVRPETFHNINSEAAWQMILADGERLRRLTRLHASIFAFQFGPDGRKPVGFAAYFLERAMPVLTSLTADNQRFIEDAASRYGLDREARSRMHVLYQPCRLFPFDGPQTAPRLNPPAAAAHGRLQVLWAGRLDAEKRVDLFLDIVRASDFADFHVFGQVVLEDGARLPALANLHYSGPFSSPLEWIAERRFDAFLFTSRWEGLPNVLVEAGALEMAVIAPVVGGVGELITDATGYPLGEQPAVDDYISALDAIRSDGATAAKRAAALRRLIETRHAWPDFLQGVQSLPDYLPPPRGNEIATADEAPLVSVIVPCYNQGRYLVQSIPSALAACSRTIEVVVVDDGSTEPAAARWLDRAQALDPTRVRVHRQANQGLSGARNAGIALARGRFIQFLDADDLLTPNKIDAQLAQFDANPGLDVSICDFLLADETCTSFFKQEEAISDFELCESDFLYRWERGLAIPIHCGLFHRRVVDSFDTTARAKEDWLFWVGLALDGARFAYVRGHWAIYRQHAASMRRSYLRMGQAWLAAGLKISAGLGGREPLFFARTVEWFEQCYRANPAYAEEVRALTRPAEPAASPPPASTLHHDPSALLAALPADDERTPRFSIVVPVFNHYAYLEECLRSLVVEVPTDAEIVCIDDASTDPRVKDYLAALAGRHSRLKVILSPINQGISAAQNAAVARARGAWIVFVDCDDALEPGTLERVSTEIELHPEVDYFFTDRKDIDAGGKLLRIARYGGYDHLTFRDQAHIAEDLYDGMVASHLKIIRRTAYLAAGGCDARYDGVQDWDLALEIAATGILRYLPEPLYRHRVHGGSVTTTAQTTQLQRTNQVLRAHLARLRPPESAPVVVRIALPADFVEVRHLIARGVTCVADARGPATAGLILHLREFNGYFDRIEWDDPVLAAALAGYVWSPDCLVHASPLNCQ